MHLTPPAPCCDFDNTVGTTDREFRIASDGTISVAGNLDYETTPRYTLTVRATYDADGDTTTTNDATATEDVDVVIDVELCIK